MKLVSSGETLKTIYCFMHNVLLKQFYDFEENFGLFGLLVFDDR